MKYTKKPVTIEAVQFDGSSSGIGEIKAWIATGAHQRGQIRTQDSGRVLEIETLEGVMTAQPGDWIIKGVKGEFYPCKPDIFAATYEPAKSGPFDAHESHKFYNDAKFGGDICKNCGAARGTRRGRLQCGEAEASFGEGA